MDASNFRIIVDPLYGRVSLDIFLADLISQPEMQRLRDVRLSNINSLLLPGGANISRFEHSVGTALLAERVSRSLGLVERDRLSLVCAALLHDVTITPFGHLMEEAFQASGMPFNHELRLQQVFVHGAEVGNVDRQIFRGRTAGFRSVLERSHFRRLGITSEEVLDLMRGDGTFGPLVKGAIDVDNIDNVCRMAHHIGIPFRRQLPLDIADGFMRVGEQLCFDVERRGLIEEWLDLRRRLYSVLMTNPIDFSAKAMLIEAMRLAIVGMEKAPGVVKECSWSFTDRELLNAISEYDPSLSLVERWELGDYFDVLGLHWLHGGSHVDLLRSRGNASRVRNELADALRVPESELLIYWIRDKRARRIDTLPFRSKTEPAVAIETSVGEDSDKVLFGTVTSRKGFVTRAREDEYASSLADILGVGVLSKCDPRRHVDDAFNWTAATGGAQRTLF